MIRNKQGRAGPPVAVIYVRKALLPGEGQCWRGRLHIGGRHIPCILGRSGIQTRKREGDGATPKGVWEILGGFFRMDRVKRSPVRLPMSRISRDDGWCDTPDHRQYNRQVKLPFSASHERLWREDQLYDTVLVLDYNFSHRIRNKGSAIFFHIASADQKPTEGCIAISAAEMRKILPLLRQGMRLVVC
jgi:L,D-peptidoglycan transpeptidase YkuD (ErfK/YbiS/YcfS/YnhG family)